MHWANAYILNGTLEFSLCLAKSICLVLGFLQSSCHFLENTFYSIFILLFFLFSLTWRRSSSVVLSLLVRARASLTLSSSVSIDRASLSFWDFSCSSCPVQPVIMNHSMYAYYNIPCSFVAETLPLTLCTGLTRLPIFSSWLRYSNCFPFLRPVAQQVPNEGYHDTPDIFSARQSYLDVCLKFSFLLCKTLNSFFCIGTRFLLLWGKAMSVKVRAGRDSLAVAGRTSSVSPAWSRSACPPFLCEPVLPWQSSPSAWSSVHCKMKLYD